MSVFLSLYVRAIRLTSCVFFYSFVGPLRRRRRRRRGEVVDGAGTDPPRGGVVATSRRRDVRQDGSRRIRFPTVYTYRERVIATAGVAELERRGG